ncbi:MAG: hypothetical protein HKN08_05545 [Gammaproteobacteria bacterium]|nr:hypothetical protein [Gammaproteobacteria bacterium]
MMDIVNDVKEIDGIDNASYMVEAFLPSFYVPGAGTRGVPLYLIHDIANHNQTAYSEDELGINDTYSQILERVASGYVALSPAVADFWEPGVGGFIRLGVDADSNTVSVPSAGVLGHLPGMPPRSVTNREGYVQSRVDYLNYLFDQAAYVVADTESSHLQDLEVFIPRTVLMVKVNERVLNNADEMQRVRSELASTLPVVPLEVHTLPEEIEKVGSDMFVILTIENMKIYLVGGIALALIAILAIAMANYMEDKRSLSLLRIRGTSPDQLRKFIQTMLLSPAIIALIIGAITAFIAGYGLTNRVWELREIKSVVQMLNTNFVLSGQTLGLAVFILAIVTGSAWLISAWVFKAETRQVHQ